MGCRRAAARAFASWCALACVLVGASDVGAGEPARPAYGEQPRIEAVATAVAHAQPDGVRIRLRIEVRGDDESAVLTRATADANALVKRLRNFVRPNGVAVVRRVSLAPASADVDASASNGAADPIRAVAAVDVESMNVARAPKLVEAATRSSNVSLESVETFVRDAASVRSRAVEEAGRLAREEAGAAARSLGVELGPLVAAVADTATCARGRSADTVDVCATVRVTFALR